MCWIFIRYIECPFWPRLYTGRCDLGEHITHCSLACFTPHRYSSVNSFQGINALWDAASSVCGFVSVFLLNIYT